jgi:TonB family protein
MNQKFKIMKPGPELSDAEIRSYMDFDGVIKKQRTLHLKKSVLRWGAGLVFVAILIAITVSIYPTSTTNEETSDDSQSNFHERKASPIDSSEYVVPETNTRTEREPEISVTESREVDANVSQEKNTFKREDTSAQTRVSDQVPSSAKTSVDSPANADVYVQAEPEQGYKHLYEYFNQNLKYPPDAIADSLQGGVVVSFVIAPDGKVDQIKMIQNIDESFSKEVESLIEHMPAWKPATLNGKPVPSRITLPLTFQILHVKP